MAASGEERASLSTSGSRHSTCWGLTKTAAQVTQVTQQLGHGGGTPQVSPASPTFSQGPLWLWAGLCGHPVSSGSIHPERSCPAPTRPCASSPAVPVLRPRRLLAWLCRLCPLLLLLLGLGPVGTSPRLPGGPSLRTWQVSAPCSTGLCHPLHLHVSLTSKKFQALAQALLLGNICSDSSPFVSAAALLLCTFAISQLNPMIHPCVHLTNTEL